MKNLILLACLFLGSVRVWAVDPSGFHRRFELVRRDGKLIKVVDRSLNPKFRMIPYLRFVKGALLEEKRLMSEKSDYSTRILDLFADDLALEEGPKGVAEDWDGGRAILDSLYGLFELDVEEVFSNPRFRELMSRFEERMARIFERVDPRILAYTGKSDFFYKREMVRAAVSWGLALAESMFSHAPVLNTAVYILARAEELVRRSREFHQNIFLHYVEKVDSKGLGMTDGEVDLVLSSIYESRIPLTGIGELRKARKNWPEYGIRRFHAETRMANRVLIQHKHRYQDIGRRVNRPFQRVRFDGRDLIVNLYHRGSIFNSRPSVAFDLENPKRIARKRIVIQLAELGLSFIPAPSWGKRMVGSYLKSHYKSQRITEGALYGHFESMRDKAGTQAVKLQYWNPFDVLD